MAGPLKVRMALVTGTALEPGSGRAIDLVLDERGADVVIHGVGHDGEGLERVREVRARTLLDVGLRDWLAP